MVLFFCAVLISFIGSLQIGVLSTSIITVTLQNGRRQALMVALGGTVPELIYAGLAILLLDKLQAYTKLLSILSYITAFLLFAAGIYFLMQKFTIKPEQKKAPGKSKLFSTGLFIALLNPQLVGFWFTVLLYLQSVHIVNMQSTGQNIGFAIGAGIGAFILFLLLINFTYIKKDKLIALLQRYKLYKLIGLLFILMSTLKFIL